MNNSIIIGVIGVLATIVFGFLSIDLFKRKRYPGKITYVKLSLIDLLNNIANNFDEIKLLHNEQPINKNIMYLKGALLNNGDIDINSKLTEKDVTIELPENCKWLDIKPTKFSDGLSVNIDNQDSKYASFKFDLFRRNEFVQFEGIIESDNNEMISETLENEMIFSHRIESTSKIEKKNLLSEREIKKKKRSAIIYSAGLLLILLTITLTFVFNLFGTKAETLYFENKIVETQEIYKVQLNGSMVKLKPVFTNEDSFQLTTDDFNKNYIATDKKLTLWQKFKNQYWMLSIQLGFFVLIVLWELFEINAAKRLSKILNK